MHATTPTAQGAFTLNEWMLDSGVCKTGHYQIEIPGGTSYNSVDGKWCHTNNFVHNFSIAGGKDGFWCAVFWVKNSNGTYTFLDRACLDIT
jgi:hypothetical protein